ncbi:hypothetical protein CBR_g38671 [Chara braunii]|uniref:Myb-like domain-containing protein n=1 Tax=Chara braunii TaxID=69332 RepID=A0A388K0R1_CHABU|nr:hypothetical protein CBR_g38671 [Chara braunii]|eukprot:GBG63605.1 hypothetical protein CBR_g38671 [Chara braunii]
MTDLLTLSTGDGTGRELTQGSPAFGSMEQTGSGVSGAGHESTRSQNTGSEGRPSVLVQLIRDVDFGDIEAVEGGLPAEHVTAVTAGGTVQAGARSHDHELQAPPCSPTTGGDAAVAAEVQAPECSPQTMGESGGTSALAPLARGGGVRSGHEPGRAQPGRGQPARGRAGRARGGHPRPQFGEEETMKLIRCRYEVKATHGDDSEAWGLAKLKQRLWPDVEKLMREANYDRSDEECKNRWHFVLNNLYRAVKDHDKWSVKQKYFTMNQMERKRWGLDFLMRREWYNFIDQHEKDKDTINMDDITDPGAETENVGVARWAMAEQTKVPGQEKAVTIVRVQERRHSRRTMGRTLQVLQMVQGPLQSRVTWPRSVEGVVLMQGKWPWVLFAEQCATTPLRRLGKIRSTMRSCVKSAKSRLPHKKESPK